MPASSSSVHFIPHDVLTLQWEDHIWLAIAAIQESGTKPNGNPCYSAWQAEKDFGVLRSSLGLCLKGIWYFTRPFSITHSLLGGKSHHKAHVEAQLLTPAQEEVLVEWIKVQGCRGVPITYVLIYIYSTICTSATLYHIWTCLRNLVHLLDRICLSHTTTWVRCWCPHISDGIYKWVFHRCGNVLIVWKRAVMTLGEKHPGPLGQGRNQWLDCERAINAENCWKLWKIGRGTVWKSL
jgi:hypothetical protein